MLLNSIAELWVNTSTLHMMRKVTDASLGLQPASADTTSLPFKVVVSNHDERRAGAGVQQMLNTK
jgi:hypothetical protein